MKLNKKGEIPMMLLFEIVAIMIIIAIVAEAAWEFSEGKTTGKIILGKDLGYMVESFISVPGDSFTIYPKNISDYVAIMSNYGVTIKEKNDATDEGISFKYTLPGGYGASGVADSDYACLIKKDSFIYLENCEDIVSNISEII